MKPWEQISDNTFDFCTFDAAYEAIQLVQDPVLAKVLTFQVHELKTLRVRIPITLIEYLASCEELVEKKITPPPQEIHAPPPVPEYNTPENFIVAGIPLVSGLHLNFDFGFTEGDRERFKHQKPIVEGRYNFSNIKKGLEGGTQAILCDRSTLVPLLLSFYRAVYPLGRPEQLVPLVKMSARYACFALPCLSKIQDRGTLTFFWESAPTDEMILKFWEETEPSELTQQEKMTLPFEFLFADYRANGDKSVFFEKTLEHTKRFFYGYQLFMTLTCFRMMLSCVFSTPMNTESRITRVFSDTPQPDSLWNLYRNDKTLGFLTDEAFNLDFDLQDSNQEAYSRILEKYGSGRIKQMWVNILGERLPTAAGLNVIDPKKTLTEIFDRRLQIHETQDWRAFLDDPLFGLVWSIIYNTAPRLRHEYRRLMIMHFDKQGMSL